MIRYKNLVCRTCGGIFGAENVRRYCSDECKNKRQSAVPAVFCKVCGKMFIPKPYHGKRQEFCSRSCVKGFHLVEHPKLICEQCGKEFDVYPSRLKHGNPRFCSQSCAGNMKKWENERFTRVKSKTWNEIRKSILERDGYKCARCDSKDKLTVHHIVRWVFTKDDSPSNLITLCRSCHWSIEWNGVSCPLPKT